MGRGHRVQVEMAAVAFLLFLPLAGATFARNGGTSGVAATSSNPAAVAAQGQSVIKEPTRPLVNPPSEAPSRPGTPTSTGPLPATTAPKPQEPRFHVSRIKFEGNTVVPATALAPLARACEGRQVTLTDLRALTREVQSLYAARGYFLARALIPVQELTSGEVRILISEGRLGETRVEGAKHHSTRFIERFFSPARTDGIARELPIQRALLILNEFPDLEVQSVLVKGKAPGTTDVFLKVADACPVHLGLGYDNYGNRLTGQNRAEVTIWGGNTLFEGDQVVVKAIDQFPSDSQPLKMFSYSAPVGDRGSQIGFQFSSAATTVGQELQVLDIRGDARIYGLTFNRPIERTVKRSSNVTAGLVSKSVKNFVFADQLQSKDELRIVQAGYNAVRRDRHGATSLATVLTQGLGTLLGGEPNGDRMASRVDAGNGFIKLNADVYRFHQVDQRRMLIFRGSGQLTTRPLVNAELFGIGGPDSVRGFIQSEFLGDDGFAVSAEYDHTVLEMKNAKLQLVGFLDHGRASLHRPQPGERESRALTGVGGGLRLRLGKWLTSRVDVGFPLSPERTAQGDSSVLYVQVQTRF